MCAQTHAFQATLLHKYAMGSISTETKIRILTVGDGDLSLSLALARAYGSYVSLTASVLDSQERL